jgi:hypothetical protein
LRAKLLRENLKIVVNPHFLKEKRAIFKSAIYDGAKYIYTENLE